MFAGVHHEDILVRLPEGERQMLLSQGGRRWEPTPGRVMKDYLLLPVDAEPATLTRWLKLAFAHAAALPEHQQKTQRPQENRRAKDDNTSDNLGRLPVRSRPLFERGIPTVLDHLLLHAMPENNGHRACAAVRSPQGRSRG
jgi:hypothetical protein